jgi:integrase
MATSKKGLGTIYYRNDRKVYEGRIKVNTKANGKPKYKYVIRKHKTDVLDELVKIKAQLNDKVYIEPSKIKVIDWVKEWLAVYKRSKIAEQTYNTYEMVISKMLAPLLWDVKLKDITPLMLQSIFNELSKKYAPSTLRKIKSILKSAFRVAIQNDMMVKNPMIGIQLPKLQKPRIESLNVKEVDQLREAAKGYNIYEAVEIALSTGLRVGELLALEWSDINYKSAEIRICKTLIVSKADKGQEFTKVQHTLKTENSQRSVRLSSSNAEMLKAMKKRRMAENVDDNGIVFCSTKGTYIQRRNFNRTLGRICKTAGIKEISANILRHTYGSIAIDRNIGAKTVSRTLGHSKIETTFNNYVHPSKDKDREAAEIMSFNRQTDNKTDKPIKNR